MLRQLNIDNFMVFHHLEIPTLKRVNLISGKNNVGKTTLLDAIRIQRSRKGEIEAILFDEEGVELSLEMKIDIR